jgi:hypothetical protein
MTSVPNYNKINKMEWYTKGSEIPTLVKDMSRSHIQNSMNWCIRRQQEGGFSKDGHPYSVWVSVFFAKLMDPNLP